MSPLVYRALEDRPPRPLALLKESREFGFAELDLVEPPGRFLCPRPSGGPLRTGIDAERAVAESDLVELLARLGADESAMAQSRRALAKLFAWYLLAEDPQRRLDAKLVSTLAHQASVVRHILSEEKLRSVLLADEVGLGKTIEAGLLVKELLETAPTSRVLYLAPAGLIRNVFSELTRLELPFRRWAAGYDEARMTDPLVLASIHRAVHPANVGGLVEAPPWDFIIIDECHHLSDWQKGGGKPTAKYKLAEALRQRLGPNGRLLLMSGTPHQGHPDRFENLLKLLRRGDEPRAALAGRVIYRTKDDIRDWDGDPVFPLRNVLPPQIVNLGELYKRWLGLIHHVFEVRPQADAPVSQVKQRAYDWRCGQALQWATSSIQAGLGYLVRQAIRAGWDLDSGSLRAAVAALRPYRSGAIDEPVPELFERLREEIGCADSVEDIEDPDELEEREGGEARWRPSRVSLETALSEGLQLLRVSADAKWNELKTKILDHCGDEKVVLFAQPIETVTALAAYLSKLDGRPPAIIIGGQDADERMAQVAAFCSADGPRFLVSSKAGGEGLNLQVARVLVHVDVPWNPMDLEQRVGRVHRFLSKRTIQVHTLVVQDSREVHIYETARQKLRGIATTMGQQRFEELFSRVMALVPPEELAGVLMRDGIGPLADRDVEELGQIVTAGYRRWEAFHDEFAHNHREIRAVGAGNASHGDLVRFAIDHAGAVGVEGFSSLRFREVGGEVIESSRAAEVVMLDGEAYACADHGGAMVQDARGLRARQLGVNVPQIQQALRRLGLGDGEATAGAFHVQLPKGGNALREQTAPLGLLFYARSVLSMESAACREIALELLTFCVEGDEQIRPIAGGELGELMRALLDARVRREGTRPEPLMAALRRAEERLASELRRPPDRSKRYALFPLVAGIVEPG